MALEEGAGNRLLVDRVVGGEAHLFLREAAVLADLQEHDVGGGVDAGCEPRHCPEAHRLADRHIDGDMGPPRLDGRHASRGVAHDVDRHPLDGGPAAPVAVEGLKRDAAALLVFHHLVGAGADRLPLELVEPERARDRPSARRSCTGSRARSRPRASVSEKCMTALVGETTSMSFTRRQRKEVSSLRPPSGTGARGRSKKV